MYNGLTFWTMMGRFGGGARGKRRNNQATNRQLQLEHMYIRVLSEMCVARFKWFGLEDDPRITSDELFLEKELMHGGLVAVYYDKRYDTILTPRATVAGQRNNVTVQGVPVPFIEQRVMLQPDSCFPWNKHAIVHLNMSTGKFDSFPKWHCEVSHYAVSFIVENPESPES
jgi:hypothetical protein